MRLIILVCYLVLILRTNAQIPADCVTSVTNRPPENSDMTVTCGTTHIDVSIFICPVYNALYNESLMVLNNQNNKAVCYGTPDWTVTPPVLNFRFPLNASDSFDCKNDFTVNYITGTGSFSDFSSVPFVNISGIINSIDPSAGQITYREQIKYKYSCNYPMQYLLNNTEVAVSGVSVAIKDNNGSFISTLHMYLYNLSNYENFLIIPPTGLDLKTKIYVAVKATNLTERFNVLLDRCFATTSPYQADIIYYDLFVGCPSDPQTKIELNGDGQIARFSFEAFRFVEHKNLSVSTFYLHCTTRLCQVEKCSSFKPDCSGSLSRRRREAPDNGDSNIVTISSGPISVGHKNVGETQTLAANHATTRENSYSGPVVAIIICLSIITIFITGLTVYLVLFMKHGKPTIS